MIWILNVYHSVDFGIATITSSYPWEGELHWRAFWLMIIWFCSLNWVGRLYCDLSIRNWETMIISLKLSSMALASGHATWILFTNQKEISKLNWISLWRSRSFVTTIGLFFFAFMATLCLYNTGLLISSLLIKQNLVLIFIEPY